MADREIIELQTKLTADDQASKKIDDVADKVDDLTKKPFDIEITAKGADATSQDIKQLGQDLQGAAEKAAALGQEDVTIRINSDDIAGVKEQFEGLDAEMQTVDEDTVDVKINTEQVATAGQEIEGFGSKLDGFKAKATQAGQSLSGFGKGFAGSLGDVGQILGGLGDSLGGLGQTASTVLGTLGGISSAGLGIGAVLAPLIGGLSEMGQDATNAAAATKEMTTALLDMKSAVQGAVDAMVTDKVKGFGTEFLKFGITTDQLGQAITGTQGDLDQFYGTIGRGLDVSKGADDATSKMNTTIRLTAGELRDAWTSGTALSTTYALTTGKLTAAQIESANQGKLTGDQQKQLNDILADGTVTVDEVKNSTFSWATVLDNTTGAIRKLTDPQKQQNTQWDAAVAGMDKVTAATTGLDKARQALLNFSTAANQGTLAAGNFGKAFQQSTQDAFAVHQTYADVEEGIGTLSDKVKGAGADFQATGGHLTTFTQTGRDMIDTVQQLATSVGSDLSERLKTSGGDFDSVRTRAEELRTEISQKLIAAGVDHSHIDEYLNFLGLQKPQIEATIKLTIQQDAQSFVTTMLPLVQGIIDKTPGLLVPIATSIAANDPVTTKNMIMAILNNPTDPNLVHILTALLPANVQNTQNGINSLTVAPDGKPWTAHIITQADITGLQGTLSGVTDQPYGATVTVQGEVDPVTGAITGVTAGTYAATVVVNGETKPATVSITEVEGEPGKYNATVTVDGNTQPAELKVGNFQTNTNNTTATVKVGADTSLAAKTIEGLDGHRINVFVTPVLQNQSGRGGGGIFMAGGPVNKSGFYGVGEAGRETVYLPAGSQVETAGQTMVRESQSQPITVNYYVTVNAPAMANLAEVGNYAISAIKAAEKRSGTRWRTAS